MATGQLHSVLRHIRKIMAADKNGVEPDRELLDRFARARDEAAFAALVNRHGAMVLAVCRRVLGNAHDAEDACQAVFLVLARKAGSIRKKDSLASWLYGVAYRASANLKRGIRRRQAREAAAAAPVRCDADDVSWREVKTLLDEEVARLPQSYQAPLILCYLEGKTRDEAARELGWSAGAVKAKLERGRDLLRGRLTRRGLSLSAALLPGLLASDAAAASLSALQTVGIVKAGLLVAAGQTSTTSLVSARAILLMEGVLRAMFAAKLKLVAVVFLTASLAGVGLLMQSGITASADQPGDEPGSSDIRAAEPRPGTTPQDSAAVVAYKRQSQNNLKQLSLAMHNYLDAYRHFPPPAIYAGGATGPGAMLPGGPPGAMGAMWMDPMPTGGRPGSPVPGSGPRGQGGKSRSKPRMQPGGFQPPGGGGSGPGVQPPGAGFPGGGPAAPGAPGGTGGFAPSGGAPQAPGKMPPGAGLPPGPGGFPGSPPAGGAGGAPTMPGAGGMAGAPMMVGASHTGRALLSWRVAILPFLGENELYRQFHLNESWDSPHNLKLLKRMPRVFAPPGIKSAKPYTTFYQVFVGPHAGFEKHRGLPISAFLDGTSNIILIIEAGHAVPWTKPTDLPFASDEPLPELGGMFPGVMHAAFADGSVHSLRKNCDQEMLRLAIMRDDGSPIDRAKLGRPVSLTANDLVAEKKELTEAVRVERAQLDALHRELTELKKANTAGAEELRRENESLRAILERLRHETELLRAEIERMRNPSNKK